MLLSDIEHLAVQGESETVEFKETTGELRQALESICGFLNTRGGLVLIGIKPSGKIVGQDVSDRTQQEIANAIRKIEPFTSIPCRYVPVPGTTRQVIVLSADRADEMIPFTVDGRPYHRLGTTTPLMPQERYQELLLQRMHNRTRWENTPAVDNVNIPLDEEEILRTARLGIAAGRLPERAGDNVEDLLERLGLRSQGKILNAAFVLFGEDFLTYYPQCQLRMARFKGVDKTEFLDNRQVQGHGFALLDEALLFLRRHLPVAGRIQPGLFERADEPLFPLVALREALVNAFCHRDYSQAGGAVSLAIFDDRLEIWSAGTLPFGLTVEDLKRDHQSRPRNPLIADVFYKRGLVERWGRGTQKIVELCVAAGQPEPEFIEEAGAVGVRFIPSGYIAPYRVGLDLTTRQRELLHIISGSEPTPLRFIMQRLNGKYSEASVKSDLGYLRNANLVSVESRGRGAIWKLNHDVQ